MRNITNRTTTVITLDPPPVGAILGPLSAPKWMLDEAASLSTAPGAIYRLASLGLIARLWTPASKEVRLSIMRGELPDPTARILNWLRTVAREDIEAIAFDGISSVDSLSDEVDSIIHKPVSLEDDIGRMVEVVDSRDAFESAAALLGGRQPAAAFRTALKFFDNKVVSNLERLPPVSKFLDTPRNRAVFLREPLSWWGYGEE